MLGCLVFMTVPLLNCKNINHACRFLSHSTLTCNSHGLNFSRKIHLNRDVPML